MTSLILWLLPSGATDPPSNELEINDVTMKSRSYHVTITSSHCEGEMTMRLTSVEGARQHGSITIVFGSVDCHGVLFAWLKTIVELHVGDIYFASFWSFSATLHQFQNVLIRINATVVGRVKGHSHRVTSDIIYVDPIYSLDWKKIRNLQYEYTKRTRLYKLFPAAQS